MVALSPRQAQRIAECLLHPDAQTRLTACRAADPLMVDYLLSLVSALQGQRQVLALLAQLDQGSDDQETSVPATIIRQ